MLVITHTPFKHTTDTLQSFDLPWWSFLSLFFMWTVYLCISWTVYHFWNLCCLPWSLPVIWIVLLCFLPRSCACYLDSDSGHFLSQLRARFPSLHHGLSYSNPSVLLPSGSPTSRSLIVCVQCEHWMHTSTELPFGEGRTNYLFATVPLREVFLLQNRPSV